MTNLPDLEQRVSGVNAQLGKAYVTGAKEAKSLSLSYPIQRLLGCPCEGGHVYGPLDVGLPPLLLRPNVHLGNMGVICR